MSGLGELRKRELRLMIEKRVGDNMPLDKIRDEALHLSPRCTVAEIDAAILEVFREVADQTAKLLRHQGMRQ